ncbi:MAG: hypothetical protein KJ069_04110 [Anaerolineae bacterium]|nr:hypothetical protein [Anaerolineae bacterium]
MLHTRSRRLFIAFIMALALTIIFILLGQGQGTAAGGGLPPRPTTSPTPTTTPVIPTATPVPATPTHGAAIRLHTSEPMPGAWTVVQWQNEHGNWYDVVGWRGHLDEGQADMKTWWVYPANYGQGPFRWVLYASEGGKQVAVSDSFDMPTRNGQLIVVEIEFP